MMKAAFLSLLFSLLFAVFAISQEEEWPGSGDVTVAGKIGFASSTYYGDDTDSDTQDRLYSFFAGIQLDYFLSKTWSLRSGLNYDVRGTEDEITNLKIKQTYISIPVTANWHFGKRKRWNLNFGPNLAFLTSAKTGELDLSDVFNGFDLAFEIGIGIKIPVGNSFLYIESNGLGGLTTILKDSDLNVLNERSVLTFGYYF